MFWSLPSELLFLDRLEESHCRNRTRARQRQPHKFKEPIDNPVDCPATPREQVPVPDGARLDLLVRQEPAGPELEHDAAVGHFPLGRNCNWRFRFVLNSLLQEEAVSLALRAIDEDRAGDERDPPKQRDIADSGDHRDRKHLAYVDERAVGDTHVIVTELARLRFRFALVLDVHDSEAEGHRANVVLRDLLAEVYVWADNVEAVGKRDPRGHDDHVEDRENDHEDTADPAAEDDEEDNLDDSLG